VPTAAKAPVDAVSESVEQSSLFLVGDEPSGDDRDECGGAKRGDERDGLILGTREGERSGERDGVSAVPPRPAAMALFGVKYDDAAATKAQLAEAALALHDICLSSLGPAGR
jgi:nitric oxide reductase activation protein